MTTDEKLQDLAMCNWAMFVSLLGKDALISAKIRILRDEGRTYQEICNKLNVSIMQVRHALKKEKSDNF